MVAARESRAGALAFLHDDRRRPRDRDAPALPATLDVSFVVQLVQRLREYGSAVAPLRAALEERLAARRPHRRGRDPQRDPAPGRPSRSRSRTSSPASGSAPPRIGASSSSARASSSTSCSATRPACTRAWTSSSRDRYRHVVESLAGPRGEDAGRGRSALRRRGAQRGRRRRAPATRARPRRRPPDRRASGPAFQASLPRTTRVGRRARAPPPPPRDRALPRRALCWSTFAVMRGRRLVRAPPWRRLGRRARRRRSSRFSRRPSSRPRSCSVSSPRWFGRGAWCASTCSTGSRPAPERWWWYRRSSTASSAPGPWSPISRCRRSPIRTACCTSRSSPTCRDAEHETPSPATRPSSTPPAPASWS